MIGVREFARELGVSASTLSRIENGEEPSGRTLPAILRWMLWAWSGNNIAPKGDTNRRVVAVRLY